MVAHTSLVVAVLRAVGFWEILLLKDTLFWFFSSGFALAFRVALSHESDALLRKVLWDTLKLVLILEFLTSTYTLSLVGELILTPALIFLALVDAVAATDKKYSGVARLTTSLLGAAGLALIGFAAASALADTSQLWSLDVLKLLLIAPILSVSFLPFLYIVALLMAYDRLNAFLMPALDASGPVARYARRRFRRHCRLSLRRALALLRSRKRALMLIRRREDVDALFRGD